MTEKQRQQFNQMRETLKRIANDYQTPKQLRKSNQRSWGLSYDNYEKVLEMAYENIQEEARFAVKGVKKV